MFLLSLGPLSAQPERFPINDLKAPSNTADLIKIQEALVKALPQARAATVCIEVKDGTGSGVIVSEDGLILTAAHVVIGINRECTVMLEDGTKLPAISLGLNSETDAAMARITKPGKYPYVKMDREQQALLGDWVFSLGHSSGFNKDRGSVTRIGRIVRIAQSTFQSDCTLIGGDSGGPLFDMNGRLVGIHSRVGASLQSNMHVPMREFLTHWQSLLDAQFIGDGDFAAKPKKGSGYLGIATEARKEGGLVVTKVGEGSPAFRAKIGEGDILLEMNGKPLTTRQELQAQLAEMAHGERVVMKVSRAGKIENLTLFLDER